MLACENYLYVYPRVQSDPGTQHGTVFTYRIANQARTVLSEEAIARMAYPEYDVIEIDSSKYTITVEDWSAFGVAPVLEVFYVTGIEDVYSTYPSTTGTPDLIVPIPALHPSTFAGGSGSVGDPYVVSDADQLQAMGCLIDASARTPRHYVLDRDIDLRDRPFFPIGTYGRAFTGSLDGRGHTIHDMTLDFPNNRYIGLFGRTRDAIVRNLEFDEPTVYAFRQGAIVAGNDQSSSNSAFVDITIHQGILNGTQFLGGIVGEGEDFLVQDADVDLTIELDPRYRGPGEVFDESTDRPPERDVGGIAGSAKKVTIAGGELDVRIVNGSSYPFIERFCTTAGVIGYPDEQVSVTGLTANVFMDLIIEDTATSSSANGGLFGHWFEESGVLVDSTAHLDITLRFPPRDGPQRVEDFGGIAGNPEETYIIRSSVTGSITIDTRASTSSEMVIEAVGGAFGEINDYIGTIVESHVGVDIIILGEGATVRRVGALVGEAQRFMATDVRVDGRVYSESPIEYVGGLIGLLDTTQPEVNFNRVIYRGTGVDVPGTSTDVGTLWGGALAPNGLPQGTSVYWDSDRNGVRSHDSTILGAPVRSSRLGDPAWLAADGFDMEIWCVVEVDGTMIPAISRVTAGCDGGGSDGGDSDGGSTSVPTAPTGLAGTPGNASVTLTWTAPRGDVDGYLVQSRTPNGNWRTAFTTPCANATSTCAVVGNLTNGEPTSFRVAAENGFGVGTWSTPITITAGTPPEAPSSLSTSAGDATATLTWVEPDDGGDPITGYLIESTVGVGGSWNPITLQPCTPASSTCGIASGLTNGVTIGFRIAAINALGTSPWSDVTTVTPNRNPSAPTDLTGIAGDRSVTLTWTAPTDTGGLNVTYQVDMDAGNGWMPASTTPCTPASPTCAVITDLPNGTPVSFRVTATSSAGASAYAGPIVVTPIAPADVPVITRTIPGQNRGWLILATPTAATTGHEISLDDGATWQTVTPHVGDRVIRITNLVNGRAYPVQLRSIRANDTRSEPATTLLTPTSSRVTAPDVTVAIDATTVDVTDANGTLVISVDLLVTNAGSVELHDVWLQWPLPDGTTMTNLTPIDGDGAWVALDDWWYGEDVDLAPNATHRVRVTLETQP